MPPQKPNNTKLKVTSAVVVIIAVAMLAMASAATKAQQSTRSGIVSSPVASPVATTTPTTTAADSTQTTSATSTASSSSGYKDGTYTAKSDYYVPHGTEEIQVSLTIKNGIVTDSSVQNSEGNRESALYQQAFTSSYKSYVTGKNISDLNLSYVAGASDTTQGFDDAVAQIQTQAKA